MKPLNNTLSSWLNRLIGAPGRVTLQHRILNLLLFVGIVAGGIFVVLDTLFDHYAGQLLFDLGMVLGFSLFFGASRFGNHQRLVVPLAALAGLAYLAVNFFANGGIQGSTWMLAVTFLCYFVIVCRPGSALMAIFLGCAEMALCLVLETLHPEWVKAYPSDEARFQDLIFTFLFCIGSLFIVIRMLLRFYQESQEVNRQSQAQLAQSEKMASLGELLAGLNHEISSPVGVIGSSVEASQGWWLDRFPSTFDTIKPLSPEQVRALWLLLQQGASVTDAAVPDSRTRRQLKQQLVEQIQAVAPDPAASWAADLVELNLPEWNPGWTPLVTTAPGQAAFAFGLDFLMLHRSSQMLQQGYEKLAALVKALGEFSRSGQADSRSPLIPCAVVEGLDAVLTLYGAANKSTVEMVRRYSEVGQVLARPEELIQVWTNLVKNALQAMGNEGVLTITVQEEGSAVEVSIADSGPGVAPEFRDKIFTPFFTTKERGIGTGLGLGIVARIIESFHGSIHVQDAPTGGAEFVVRLPLVPSSDAAPPP